MAVDVRTAARMIQLIVYLQPELGLHRPWLTSGCIPGVMMMCLIVSQLQIFAAMYYNSI